MIKEEQPVTSKPEQRIRRRRKGPLPLAFVLVLLILLGVTVVTFFALNGPDRLAALISPDDQGIEAQEYGYNDLQTGQPLALSDGVTAKEYLKQVDPNGVGYSLVWNDGYQNCGLATTNREDPKVGACYTKAYPEYIFYYWDKDTTLAERKTALLYEYAKFLQQDEAPQADTSILQDDADCKVTSWDKRNAEHECVIEGWDENWLVNQDL